LLLSLSGWSFNALAADSPPSPGEEASQIKTPAVNLIPPSIDESKWGLGVSGTIDIGASDRIVSAEISNSVVRVSGDNNFSARVLLERHFYAKSGKGTCWLFKSANGCGSFVALQMGSTNTKVLEAFGGGYMWGWKDGTGDNVSVWNLGLGIIADPNTKVLGDGIKKDQALPAGDTLRYKTTTKFGLLILVSFGL
jgi:hypothetical protein